MFEKIVLDMLSQDSVSVKKQQYTTIDGIEYAIGEPWRRAYVNSTSGRVAVQAELPQAQQDAIFAIWGDTPTVTDESE
jgi:hypothetical protein